MHAASINGRHIRAGLPWTARRRLGGTPPLRRVGAALVVTILGLAVATTVSTVLHLHLPPPTGSFAVGKVTARLTDPARLEPATAVPADRRSVRLVTWYPAVAGTGEPAAYLADLDVIADGLVASGEVGALEVAGLRFVGDPARADADVEPSQATYPVLLLSPGNATNVEFYSALAEDLASRGFIVIGLDHPFQVAAVALDADVAIYAGDPPLGAASDITPMRIDQRVADIGFVLDQLEDDRSLGRLDGHLDLTRIGILGHSNGGVAAAQACADSRIDACLNIDGQLAGGPFSARPNPSAPTKPFMYLTKEAELHPSLAALFEARPDAIRAVVPQAAHDEFADPAMFRPRVLPTATTADAVITVSRGLVGAFFDHTLRDAPLTVFQGLAAPADIELFVYPLTPRR